MPQETLTLCLIQHRLALISVTFGDLYLGKRSQGLLQRAQACPGTQSTRQPQCTGQALQPLPAGAAPGTCTHKVHMNSQALVLADAVLKSLHVQQVSVSKSTDICMQRYN